MNTLLIEEIKDKESRLLSECSEKERYFYNYLIGKSLPLPETDTSGEIDKVCLFAFSNIKRDYSKIIKLVERLRNTEPKKGLKFTNNFVSVCAFALLNEDIKNVELRDYFNKTDIKEQFIISQIFHDFELSAIKDDSSIGILITQVYKSNNLNVVELLVDLLAKCNDLFELFIIKKSYKKLVELHPNEALKKDFNHLCQDWQKLITVIERRVWTYFISIIIVSLFFLSYFICKFVITYWSEESLNLEPILTAIGLILGLWGFIIGIYFIATKKPENFISVFLINKINKTHKFFVDFWFNRKGLNLEWINSLIDKSK
jgi:hypothetical protein